MASRRATTVTASGCIVARLLHASWAARCKRSAKDSAGARLSCWSCRSLSQALEIALAQLGLARAHFHGASADPDLVCRARHFERIAAPQHEIRNLAARDTAALTRKAEDLRWLQRKGG